VEPDDLDSEWATLKEIPGAKALTENVDLRREYMSMGEHPEFIYLIIDEMYGFKHMSVWRLKCFGQKSLGRPRYPRRKDCWIAQWDVALWKGEMVDQSEASRKHPRDMNRIFSWPKDKAFASLEALAVGWVEARDRTIARYEAEIRRWKADSAKLEENIRDYETSISAMTGLSLPSIGKQAVPDTRGNSK
jgi:hypothetical protein